MNTTIEIIGELLEKLQSPDFYDREEAVKQLGRCEKDEAVAGLVLALEDTDLGIRELAADFLVSIKGDVACQLLVRFLGSEDIGSRNLASEILVKIGSDAVPALVSEIDNDDHDVRKFIVDILGLINDERAVDALALKLKDSNINVVCSAAEALGEIGSASSIPDLFDAYANNEDVRMQAVEALGKIGDPGSLEFLYSCLNSEDPMILYASIEAIGNIGENDSVKYLLDFLDHKDITISEAAKASIVNIAILNEGVLKEDLPLDKFSDFLFEGIKNKNSNITKFTLNRLHHWYGKDVLCSLLEILDHLSEDELKPVVTMISNIGVSATEIILERFTQVSSSLKLIYLDILKKDVTPEMSQNLLSYVTDSDPLVRIKIAHLLGSSGDIRCTAALKQLTSDKVGHVRSAAYSALGWLCSASDISILFDGLKDKYPDVRDAAMGALVLVGSEEVVRRFSEDLNHEDLERQRLASTALGLIGDASVVEPLLQAINNPESSIRKSAIDSLGKIREVTDIEPLKHALNDENSSVRKSAINALIAIKGNEIIPELRFLLEDSDVWVCYHMINIIGDSRVPEYCEYLKEFVDAKEDILRIVAVKSLSKLGCMDSIPKLRQLQQDTNADLALAAKNALAILQGKI